MNRVSPEPLALDQLHVELRPVGGRIVARALFGALGELLQHARREEDVLCWFVRKDPGLRLRFGGTRDGAAFRAALESVLRSELDAGRVAHWYATPYEPELHRLGGPALIDAVHRAFSDDTACWLALSALRTAGRTRLAPELFALTLTSELLLRGTGAEEEAWDVWCGLLRTYAGEEPREPTCAPRGSATAELARVAAQATAEERVVLERALAAQARFLAALEEVARTGRLATGRRTLLAAMVAFHWNRFGLAPDATARLCRVMTARLHPARVFSPSPPPSAP